MAQRNLERLRHAFDVRRVHDQVRVVKKAGMQVHGARVWGDENKKQATTFGGTHQFDFAHHERKALFDRIKA